MPYGVMNSGTFNGVDLSVPVNRVAVASVSDEPGVVPAVQRAERHHALRLPRRVELRLDAGDAEPSDRPAAAVLRRLHAGRTEGTLGGEYSIIDPYDPSRTYGVLDDGSHAHPERVVERVPAGRRQGRHEQRDRPGPPERLAAVGHLVAGQRHPDPPELQRSGGERAASPPPTSARPTSSARATPAATRLAPVYTCDPRLGGTKRRREDSRHQLHRGARRSARTATSCRRTTSGRRRATTTT